MHGPRIPLLAGAAAIILSVLACGGTISTANISDAWMSTDADGANRTTVYAQDATFYAQADLRNAPEGTQIQGIWTAVDVQDTEPDFVIAEAELETESSVVTFDLSNDGLWPIGTYKIDLYLNDTLATTIDFEVR
jgi:hypothetical protein